MKLCFFQLFWLFNGFQTKDFKDVSCVAARFNDGEGAIILRGAIVLRLGIDAQVAEAAEGGELQRIRRGDF